MKALVLGGGSLKGAWQVGAIQAVLETGFRPDMIYGISAGALNATFMIHEASRQFETTHTINWGMVNKFLLKFWIENITKPEDIGIVKSKLTLGYSTLMSKFDGLLDPSPLHRILDKNLDLEIIRRSPVYLKVGAVNILSGEMTYVDPTEEFFMDYLKASSSIPILMPGVPIGGDYKKVYLDGGLREVVPIRKAIEDGADEIYAIATHPRKRNMERINYRNFLSLIDRIKDISVNQFENNDIDWAENYNEHLMSIGEFSINRKIKLTVIRPEDPVSIKLTDFDSSIIKSAIKDGYTEAYNTILNQDRRGLFS